MTDTLSIMAYTDLSWRTPICHGVHRSVMADLIRHPVHQRPVMEDSYIHHSI